MNVHKAGRREGEVANWSDGVPENFGALAGLASSGPSAGDFLNCWSHEALEDEFKRCLHSRVTECKKLNICRRREAGRYVRGWPEVSQYSSNEVPG